MPKRTKIPEIGGYADLFGPEPTAAEQVVEIPLEQLHDFTDHPYSVKVDDLMTETVESVAERRIHVPGIARPMRSGGYELISGHRRKLACELAGLETMPVIIREMDDDEAVITMADCNLQRETILPSERGWAYRMKLEALNHRGRTAEGFARGTLSVDLIAAEAETSRNQVFRYIRLTELVPGLLDMVDGKTIALIPAVELSYLSRSEQGWLLEAMARHEATPSLAQAKQMKKLSKAGELTTEGIDDILMAEKKPTLCLTLSGQRFAQYFPADYTPRQVEAVIFSLLESWRAGELGDRAS